MSKVKKNGKIKKAVRVGICTLCLAFAALGTYIGVLEMKGIDPDEKFEQLSGSETTSNEQTEKEKTSTISKKTSKAIDKQSELDCKVISSLLGYAIGANAKDIAASNPSIRFNSMDDFVIKDGKIYLVDSDSKTTQKYDDGKISFNNEFTSKKITQFTADEETCKLFEALQNVENFSRAYNEGNISINQFKESLKTVLAITGIDYADIEKIYTNKTGTMSDYLIDKVVSQISPFLENALQNGKVIETNYHKKGKADVTLEEYKENNSVSDEEKNSFNRLCVKDAVEKILNKTKNSPEK